MGTDCPRASLKQGMGLGDRLCPRAALTPHSADRRELWLSSAPPWCDNPCQGGWQPPTTPLTPHPSPCPTVPSPRGNWHGKHPNINTWELPANKGKCVINPRLPWGGQLG